MSDTKKNCNTKSENKILTSSSPHLEEYKKQTELDLVLHNKLLQNKCARNALNQELNKFKLSLIEYVSANKEKLNTNEKEIEILLNNFIVELYKKCGFYTTSKL
jgi:hypothetical protein